MTETPATEVNSAMGDYSSVQNGMEGLASENYECTTPESGVPAATTETHMNGYDQQSEACYIPTTDVDGAEGYGTPATTDATATAGGEESAVATDGESTATTAGGKSTAITGADIDLKFFVGGIHPDAWDDDVRSYFAKYGEVKEVRVMKDNVSGRNRGFGFVTLCGAVDKDSLLSGCHSLKDKKIEVREMQPEGSSNLKRKVFIGGIGLNLDEAQLTEYFGRFGAIEKVTIMRNTAGKCRGFGFAVYKDEDSAAKVLQEKCHKIHNEKVDVRAAEPRQKGTNYRNEMSNNNYSNYNTNYNMGNNMNNNNNNSAAYSASNYANYYNQLYSRGMMNQSYGMYGDMASSYGRDQSSMACAMNPSMASVMSPTMSSAMNPAMTSAMTSTMTPTMGSPITSTMTSGMASTMTPNMGSTMASPYGYMATQQPAYTGYNYAATTTSPMYGSYGPLRAPETVATRGRGPQRSGPY